MLDFFKEDFKMSFFLYTFLYRTFFFSLLSTPYSQLPTLNSLLSTLYTLYSLDSLDTFLSSMSTNDEHICIKMK